MFGATRHVDGESARQVIGWRIARLRKAGFERTLAGALAGDGRYDLHMLLELVDRGCAPSLAARILAPLDGPAPSGGEGASARLDDGQTAR